jgi:hypothetical protein
MNPAFDGATLRISGGPTEGDTGLIRLRPSRWKQLPGERGFVYSDPPQAAGGIRTITLHTTAKGGRVRHTGGGPNWPFDMTPAPTALSVTLTVGNARWCAAFAKPRSGKHGLKARAVNPPASCPCERFDSTWQAIQTVIFDRHGCTQAVCHGAAPSAGQPLDLRPDVAYANLVGAFSDLGQQFRVQRGSRQDSFLWRKLAAKTEGLAGVPGTPMPSGLPALSADELEAIRLWIQFGAPETGVVADTELLLNSCLPPASPPEIQAPDPPAAGTGVQFHAPPWTIRPKSEDEVCYATYQDLTSQIPDEFKVPCPPFWGGPSETCFYFNHTELTQDPNSHHSIIHIYRGTFPATDDGFAFRCFGGPQDGQKCDPTIAGVCGAGGDCHGKPKSSIGCIGYGPPDYASGFDVTGAGSDNAPSVGGSQQPFVRNVYPQGVFGIYPARAVWVWNSHAFNVTDAPITNQQWYNVYFAGAADRQYVVRGVFDAADIFVQNVLPFTQVEYCRTVTFRAGTRLFELSSHTHKRGKLFRVWGPGIAASCRSTKNDPGACTAESGSPVLVTTQYNDAALVVFSPPLTLDDPDPAARRFKFCSRYDNGASNPTEVKRNSTSPVPPQFGTLAPGGPCFVTSFLPRDLGIACLSGPHKGAKCQGDDRVCDSGPGAGDGVCDACPLLGGVTTEDEMFILLGTYFCAPGTPCEGTCAGGLHAGALCQGDDRACDSAPGANDGRCDATYTN